MMLAPTIILTLTCLVPAGASFSLKPDTGWELVRVAGTQTASAEAAAVETIPLPVALSAIFPQAATLLPGMAECKLMMDKKTLACPKIQLGTPTQKTPPPATQAEVVARRVLLDKEEVTTSHPCSVIIETGEMLVGAE